jgi:hypothetical protein
MSEQFISHIPTLIKEEDNLELNKIVSEEDIFVSIKQFDLNKSSAPMVLQFIFM